MEIQPGVIEWLLNSDPAIRWQVLSDVLHADEATCMKERARLVHSGWCARLLELQDDDGLWNHSIYNGKWISTTYTLYLMKLFGLPTRNTQALKGCNQLLTKGLYQDQEIRFSRDQEIQDLGVSALVLSICSYFGYEDESLQRMAHFLAGQQCKAGNWLPNGLQSAEAYTFETTLLVLEALLQFRNRYPEEKSTATSTAVAKGQEFLLKHSLFLTLGGPMKSGWTSFAFPPYWFYDVLVALDYFRSFQINRDGRIQPAIDLLLKRQTKDGLWMLGSQHPGKTYFEMEKAGKPSRWNTLRALRILEWWNNSSAMQPAT